MKNHKLGEGDEAKKKWGELIMDMYIYIYMYIDRYRYRYRCRY